MIIAILSDIHDRLDYLESALELINDKKADHALFLGDFCAPFTLDALAAGFTRGPIDAIFGNNDGDPFLLSSVAGKYPHFTIHGQFAELEIAGKIIALNHYPEISKRLAESQAYDAVFSGHDHQQYVHRIAPRTLWANPGEVMGRFGCPSFGFYNTESDDFEHIAIPT
ncbi:MAG: metallophosphoesterase family protein [Verrucomicrobiota bacterium]